MPIDPFEHHRAAVADLSSRHRAGEIDRDAFLSESQPHARAILALEDRDARERAIALARSLLARPALVEAFAVGLAHYLRTAARPGGGDDGRQ